MFGEDPNWGRILAAVGTAEAFIDSTAIDVYLNDSQICGNGAALLSLEKVSLKNRNIHIKVDLKVGNDKATIYTNDLSTQYVHENSAYST
jgi:glutamate N-acetyltransferase/amino-acid N-acetyltransferase